MSLRIGKRLDVDVDVKKRFWCMGCQLERPVEMLVKLMRRSRGGVLIPQYRCERCHKRQRPVKGANNAAQT